MSTGRLRIDSSVDLRRDPAAIVARRRPTIVEVRFPATAGSIATAEGEVRYSAHAAIVTGTAGERWPVERATFDASYEPVAPTRMGDDGTYRRKSLAVLARRYGEPFELVLSKDRGTLRGDAGDWLVQHAPGSLGIVAAQAFTLTYRIGE
jgi:hypothetical protein